MPRAGEEQKKGQVQRPQVCLEKQKRPVWVGKVVAAETEKRVGARLSRPHRAWQRV